MAITVHGATIRGGAEHRGGLDLAISAMVEPWRKSHVALDAGDGVPQEDLAACMIKKKGKSTRLRWRRRGIELILGVKPDIPVKLAPSYFLLK